MKLVFLADALDVQYAGIYGYCKNLLQAIDQLQSPHQIFVIRSSTQKEFHELIEIAIPIRRTIPLHQRIRQFTSIPKYINQLKPDVVVEMAHFGPFRLHASIKRVTFIHDLSPILYPQWHPVASVWAHRLALKSILQNAHLILTNSNFTQQEIKRVYPNINAAIEVTLLASTQKPNQLVDDRIFKKHHIKTPYFLYVGTIEPRKNIQVLLNAYTVFRKEHPEKKTQLVLAGKWGWKQAQLLADIENNTFTNDIMLTGFVSEAEKKALYQNALAFIYPSLYEGFGLPLLEAMENGCPVISSNTSALPEVGGSAALYFQPNNVMQLTKHLNNIATDMNDKIINTSKLVEQAKKFSWQQTALKTLQYLERFG